MILLDTHIFIWFVNGDIKQLGENYIKLIEQDDKKYLSVVSCWEISLLLRKNRLNLKFPFRDWIQNSLNAHSIEIINLDLETIFAYDKLDSFHSDPADKFIAATSISKKIPLLSFDRKLISCKGIEIVKL